ncbi:MAG TPA: DUF5106 domain-containing protein [Bacteroidales bacterium]|nr:DUF5106 domain-containing protein [Bacteroidales bacterium]
MNKIVVLIFACIVFVGSVVAQGYEIKVKVNGVADTVMYLGHHFGDKKYVVDTSKVDSKGNCTFLGAEALKKGIYIVVMPSQNMTYFEIIVGNEQKFSVETDVANLVTNMKVKGSLENKLFNDYQRKMSELQAKHMALNDAKTKYTDNPDSVKNINDRIAAVNTERHEYILNMIKNNKQTFWAKVLNSMVEVDVPEPPRDDKGNITDSTFQWRYYKQHYFDNIDFKEDGLLRTPIFQGKLNYFFEKVVIPSPDSMKVESDRVIQMAYQGDSLMFRFVAAHLLNYFETSKIMGFDEVFVHIAEQWYLSGKTYWGDSTFMAKLTERVVKISPNIIGNIAPDLKKMECHDGTFMSLHAVEAEYTILVFFEPDCGHCKKEVPELYSKFKDTLATMGVKVFLVYTQYEKDKWIDFINEKDLITNGWYNVWDGPYPHSNFRNFYDIYSTPVVFVLDKDKRIVAKRINIENLADFIRFDKQRKEKMGKP